MKLGVIRLMKDLPSNFWPRKDCYWYYYCGGNERWSTDPLSSARSSSLQIEKWRHDLAWKMEKHNYLSYFSPRRSYLSRVWVTLMYPIEAASSPRRWTTGLRIVTFVVLDCFIAEMETILMRPRLKVIRGISCIEGREKIIKKWKRTFQQNCGLWIMRWRTEDSSRLIRLTLMLLVTFIFWLDL